MSTWQRLCRMLHDGSSLLYLNRDSLMRELGVKRVHVEKLVCAIPELRDEIRKQWD